MKRPSMRWLSIAVPAAVARVYCATEIRLCQAGSNGASDGELVRVGNHQSRSGRDGHCRCCGRHGMRFQMKSSSHCSFLTPAIRPPAHSPAVPAQSVPFKDTVYDHRVAQIVNAWAGFAFQPARRMTSVSNQVILPGVERELPCSCQNRAE